MRANPDNARLKEYESMARKVIEVKGVAKYFSGVPALKDIDFDLEEGEVHALMGENGAGKSTLSKIISGIYQKDEGTYLVNGEDCSFVNTRQAVAKGVAIVTQEFSLLRDLSVAENIFITNDEYYSAGFLSNMKAMAAKTTELLKLFHMENYIDPWEKVERLTVAQMQIVEIVKALSKNARIIILDEPTASLSEREINVLFDVVRSLKKDKISFIIVSHKINEIYEISDRITVLRDGRLILGGAITSELKQSELIRAMVGREVSDLYGVANFQHRDFSDEEVLLEVNDLCDTWDFVKNVSLKVHRGEIVGLSGLVGAGRSQLVRCIFGAEQHSSGSVRMKGRELKNGSIYDSMLAGIGFVSEDRKYDGLFQEMSISINANIADLVAHRGSLLSHRKDLEETMRMKEKLRIKMNDADAAVKYLSGGNQQKVLLAKWLMIHPDLLIVDEPTRGVDIGAKADIYQILRDLAAEGTGIQVVSSEIPEIMGLCNTTLIMREGIVTGVLNSRELDEEKIGYYSTIGMQGEEK